MELLEINKNIEEQIPLLASGCMSLKGVNLHPQQIDDLLNHDRFDGMTLDTVLDVVAYASAVEFIGACKEQKYKTLNGNLVIALGNYLLRRIAIKEGFLKEDTDIPSVCSQMNDIFEKQSSLSLPKFLKEIFADIHEMELFTSDNNAFLYLILNFYLYTYRNSVLIYSDCSGDANARWSELSGWVWSWEG